MSIKDYSNEGGNEYRREGNVFTKEPAADNVSKPETGDTYANDKRTIECITAPDKAVTSKSKLKEVLVCVAAAAVLVLSVFAYKAYTVSKFHSEIQGTWLLEGEVLTGFEDDGQWSMGSVAIITDDSLAYTFVSSYYGNDGNNRYLWAHNEPIKYEIVNSHTIKLLFEDKEPRNIEISFGEGFFKTENGTAFYTSNIGQSEVWYNLSYMESSVREWVNECISKG